MLGNVNYNWGFKAALLRGRSEGYCPPDVRVENVKKQGFHDWTRHAARYFQSDCYHYIAICVCVTVLAYLSMSISYIE
jgi:hypothetical protein